jgi:hypothetical protein
MSEPSFFPPVPPAPPLDDFDDSGDLFGHRWAGPPRGHRAGLAAFSVLAGRSDTTAVLLEGARCFPSGVELTMVVEIREASRRARKRVFDDLQVTHGRGQLALALPPGGLRWGLGLADGRRVTTLDEDGWVSRPDDADPETWVPDHPVLQPLGYRDNVEGSTWRRRVWLWPLPPHGPLQVVAAWPDRGITETSTTVDATPLVDAAARSRPLWDDQS